MRLRYLRSAAVAAAVVGGVAAMGVDAGDAWAIRAAPKKDVKPADPKQPDGNGGKIPTDKPAEAPKPPFRQLDIPRKSDHGLTDSDEVRGVTVFADRAALAKVTSDGFAGKVWTTVKDGEKVVLLRYGTGGPPCGKTGWSADAGAKVPTVTFYCDEPPAGLTRGTRLYFVFEWYALPTKYEVKWGGFRIADNWSGSSP